MGFQRPSYKLTFTGNPAYDGLEVSVRAPSMDDLLTLEGAYPKAAAGDIEAQRDTMRLMAGMVTAWNYEDDDGQPVPVTFENFMAADYPMLMAIVDAWREKVAGVTGVAPPLPSGSGSTAASQDDLQIPMTPLEPPTGDPSS